MSSSLFLEINLPIEGLVLALFSINLPVIFNWIQRTWFAGSGVLELELQEHGWGDLPQGFGCPIEVPTIEVEGLTQSWKNQGQWIWATCWGSVYGVEFMERFVCPSLTKSWNIHNLSFEGEGPGQVGSTPCHRTNLMPHISCAVVS